MSAILSADDLNDFINPGVACIKPVETLPKQQPPDTSHVYEVTTEDKVATDPTTVPAQISLTDCLACSGCVTSAEAVLVSLQSHGEVLDTLDRFEEMTLPCENNMDGIEESYSTRDGAADRKIFVASISPQTRASIAATYNVTEREASYMIAQLLSGPQGLRSGGQHGSGFAWLVDTSAMREMSLVAAADEVENALTAVNSQAQAQTQKIPVITSACPGWICYAEKTHPHILPHLSKLKSPQALTGVLLKSVLAKKYSLAPDQIWHLAIMPCFDKKLEASRSELTSRSWQGEEAEAVRDVDCVITARELLMLAESRNIAFPNLPRLPLSREYIPSFPDPVIEQYLFGRSSASARSSEERNLVGTSGGYLWHVLKTRQTLHPGSEIRSRKGRNNDVHEFTLVDMDGNQVFKAARYYGFRNIQNLVRRLKPSKSSRMPGSTRRPGGSQKAQTAAKEDPAGDYAYVEVMACPGGCTNGGGQIKIGDIAGLQQLGGSGIGNGGDQMLMPQQRDWLAKVDEAYWSDEDRALSTTPVDVSGKEPSSTPDSLLSEEGRSSADVVDGVDRAMAKRVLAHWSEITALDAETLLSTTFRIVDSDVGKQAGGDVDRVAALAHSAGGGW